MKQLVCATCFVLLLFPGALSAQVPEPGEPAPPVEGGDDAPMPDDPSPDGTAADAPGDPVDDMWVYQTGDATEGPVSGQGLRELLQSRTIDAGTPIKKQGSSQWTYPGYVGSLADLVLWHYTEGSERKGPVSTARLGELAALGLVTQQTLVWRLGLAKWAPASSLGELRRALDRKPALPPSAPEEGSPGRAATPAPAQTGPTRLPGQRDQARRMMFLLGAGASIGFFSPGDVNDYMERELSGAVIQSGFSGMFLNLVPRITATFAPIEYVQIEAVGEIGLAPKIIEQTGGGSGSESYIFLRYSGGFTVTGHIPLGQHRFGLFGGAGFMYHHMEFEQYAAGTPGVRALVGFRLYREVFTPEVVLMFDYAVATDEHTEVDRYGNPTIRSFELNYTGVMIGVNFNFNILGK